MKALKDYAQYWELLDVMFPGTATSSNNYLAVVERLLEHLHSDLSTMHSGAAQLIDILVKDGRWGEVLATTSRPHELAALVLRAWQLATFSPTSARQAGPKTALLAWIGVDVDFKEPDDVVLERINMAMFGPYWEDMAGFVRTSGPHAATNAASWIAAIRKNTPPFMPGVIRGLARSDSIDLPELEQCPTRRSGQEQAY